MTPEHSSGILYYKEKTLRSWKLLKFGLQTSALQETKTLEEPFWLRVVSRLSNERFLAFFEVIVYQTNHTFTKSALHDSTTVTT